MSTDMAIIRESMKLKARLRLSRTQRLSGPRFKDAHERRLAVMTMRALCEHENAYLLGAVKDGIIILAHEYRCDDCNMQIEVEVAF